MKTAYSKLLTNKNAPTKIVLNELRTHLISGRYARGARLLEAKIAETYGVSRGTIRSILQELSSEGLVEFINSGTCIVVGIDEKIIRDIYDLRCQLEMKAASIILSDQSNLCLPIVEVLAEYKSRPEDPSDQKNSILYHTEIDMRFHQAFVYCSQNRPIFRAWCSMSPVIRTLLSINVNSDYWSSYADKFYMHHKAILDYALTKNKRLFDEIESQIVSGVENSIRQLQTFSEKVVIYDDANN